MTIDVSQMKPGMVVRFELGDYGNWVTAKVVQLEEVKGKYVCFLMNDEDRGNYRVWFNVHDTVEAEG